MSGTIFSGEDVAFFRSKTGLCFYPEPVGGGGMGVVYRAFDDKGDYAVKMLRRQPIGGTESTVGWSKGSSSARFRRERDVMLPLCHPNLVPLKDISRFMLNDGEEVECLILPFYKNGTLADVLLHSTVPYEEFVVEKLSEVCEGLAYLHLHERKIVHRDVKLENIFIDDTGRALLGDFGLVRVLEDATRLTDNNEFVGTPHYFPPEQLRILNGHPEVPHPLWDVYAVGVCLFAAVYNSQGSYGFFGENKVYPYGGNTPLEVMNNINYNNNREALSLREGVRQEKDLKFVVERLLERNPKKRVQSAKIAGKLLRRWLNGERIIPA